MSDTQNCSTKNGCPKCCNKTMTLGILAVSLLAFTVFQMSQILIDRSNLHKFTEQAQENNTKADKALADDQKMLDQLNAIAIGTQRLAEAGNANAKEIVQQLNRLGIKINPNFKEDQEKAAATKKAEPGQAPVAPSSAPPAPALPAPPPAVPPSSNK